MEKRAIVLVIEDDVADQQILRRAAAEGFSNARLDMVSSGREALSYLDRLAEAPATKVSPDLIFLDLNLPGLDGFQTLRELRLRKQTSVTPIILFTTSSATKDAIKGYETGANTFITKPSSYDELVLKLKIIDAYWFSVATLPSIDNAA